MAETSLMILLPLLGAMLAMAAPQAGGRISVLVALANVFFAGYLAWQVSASGAVTVPVGGWTAPLGIALLADGLAVVMLMMTAMIGLIVTAHHALTVPATQMGQAFYPMWLTALAALNALYLSADLFNIYVGFEILGLASVGLTALSRKKTGLQAAYSYLVAGLMGSLLFLLGIALTYAAAGRVDFAVLPGLAETVEGRVALALMLVGLAVKAALFPLHFWMPDAHASAVPTASALLSALVVKAALYMALRFGVTGGLLFDTGYTALALLGAAGMIWGSIGALRADRLKTLVAHSTVAQVGLIVLAIGVARDPAQGPFWQAAVLLMLSHGFAKAGMFLAVGRIAEGMGHDRIAGLTSSSHRPGAAELAFGLTAISLIGLPPTAGFIGKWTLMQGLILQGHWLWVGLLVLGTLMSAAYMTRVLSRSLRSGPRPASTAPAVGLQAADIAALGLAVIALALGFVSGWPLSALSGGAL